MNATQRNKVGSKFLLSATLSALLFCTATAFAGVDEANKECASIKASSERDMCFYNSGRDAVANPFSGGSQKKSGCPEIDKLGPAPEPHSRAYEEWQTKYQRAATECSIRIGFQTTPIKAGESKTKSVTTGM